MIKPLGSKKTYRKILFIAIFIYVLYIFIGQQKTLNSYKNSKDYYISKINEQEEYRENLMSMKENVDSTEYIEEMAREKLDMYLPNERVYVDMGK